MGKKIFIHIGFKKTASTAIQRGFFHHYSELLEEGVLYPETGRGFAHQEIGYLISKDPLVKPRESILVNLAEEIAQSPAQTAVISSEIFCNAPESQIRKLKSVFSEDDEFFIVAIIRRQDLWMQSLWSQLFKNARTTDPFETFLADVIEGKDYPDEPIKSFYIRISNPDFYYWIQPWEKVFGADHVIVRVLEKSQIKENILVDFLDLVGVKDPHRFDVKQMNISPSAKTLEVLRFFYERVKWKELTYLRSNGYFLANSMREFAEAHGWNTQKHYTLTREIHDNLARQYEASNALLAQRYFGRDQLFLEPYHNYPITSYDLADLTAAEVLELTGYILHDLVQNRKFVSSVIESHQPDDFSLP